jgi:hypothetical protein
MYQKNSISFPLRLGALLLAMAPSVANNSAFVMGVIKICFKAI